MDNITNIPLDNFYFIIFIKLTIDDMVFISYSNKHLILKQVYHSIYSLAIKCSFLYVKLFASCSTSHSGVSLSDINKIYLYQLPAFSKNKMKYTKTMEQINKQMKNPNRKSYKNSGNRSRCYRFFFFFYNIILACSFLRLD